MDAGQQSREREIVVGSFFRALGIAAENRTKRQTRDAARTELRKKKLDRLLLFDTR